MPRGAISCLRQCGHWRTLARSTAGSRVGHYNYFRSYSAERGRYTQADPIGLDGGFNRFGYVRGDALSSVDFLGLSEETLPLPLVLPICAANPVACGGAGGLVLGGIIYPIVEPVITKTIEWCANQYDCILLEQQIRALADEIRSRYFELLRDRKDLYNKAHITRINRRDGTWIGHKGQMGEKIAALKKLIERADSLGCKVNPLDRLLVQLGEPPVRPAK
ncbi:RHS repeat-associated core domain-containing protein [Acidovorax soli]|uniref:RHS repeat-associated core domain-containing protein n=1 Tax=Acidovorax soli TaxID=592050 RepID=UPI00161BCCD4